MEMNDVAAVHSTRLTYSTLNLRPRDEMVFKTLLRLIAPKLNHRWDLVEKDGDLLLWGDQPLSDMAQVIACEPPQHSGLTIWLGQSPRSQGHYLTLPLLPARVQENLDLLGVLLVARKQSRNTISPLIKADQQLSQTTQQNLSQANSPPPPAHFDWADTKLRFKLKRWPPQECLGTAPRIKMATAMLAVPLTLESLCQRGATDDRECMRFLKLLHERQVLQILNFTEESPLVKSMQAAVNPAVKDKVTPMREGLLARIRHRLGL